MLIKPSIDELENIIPDRSALVTLVAQRSRDLVMGKKAITEEVEVNPVSQAAKEVAECLIGMKEREME